MSKSKKGAPVEAPPALGSPDESNSQVDFNTPSVHGTIKPILKNKRHTQTLGAIDEQSSLSQVPNQMVNVTVVDDHLLEKRSLNFTEE